MSVVGNLSVKEGYNVYLRCEHQSGFPVSIGSVFFFNGAATYLKKVIKLVKLLPTCSEHAFSIEQAL